MLNNPSVIYEHEGLKREVSLASVLHSERTIFMTTQFDEHSANIIIQQLLTLSSTGNQKDKDIWLYINSPGGVVTQGKAIIDVMNSIKPKVHTVVVGMAASMGAVLLAAGTGTRYAMPNSEIMIHQPLGGASGQASDIIISADHIKETKRDLTQKLADYSNTTFEELEYLMDRDYYMKPERALELGLIDEIIATPNDRQLRKKRRHKATY